ncbi:MAG TPA: N-acetylglucosamine-6-phosphate deacetylase [Anaerolineales bacterium]|nr:N-acetylglucosamine-6-phosphate deacetylase [Anaerolineales bacterium]
MSTLFFDATVFTPHTVLERHAVAVADDGTIAFVGPAEDAPEVHGPHLNLRGRILAPGFIDIHVHGGNGIGFGEKDLLKGLTDYSRWVAGNGVSGFLLSIAAPSAAELTQMTGAYAAILGREMPGAEPLGLHLEGPFLNPEKKGAFNPAWLHTPSIEEAQGYLDAGKGWIRQMTIAPELPNAGPVANLLRKNGVTVALGHTNTDYETASRALRGDFVHVTHTFNAQSSFDHRTPGVFGAVLSSDYVTAELIADGVHVHPAPMKVLIRSLGTDRVVIITDAMTGAGLNEGTYWLAGNEVTVKDGRATLKNGTLAGSIATLDQCVRNVHQLVGFPLHEAVKMASLNPARAMGLGDRLGTIQPGKVASLTVIDEDVHVYLTMVKGKIVYNNL